jgi:hypothetical protein
MKWGSLSTSVGGALILSLSLIQGCGSDSKPAGTVGAACSVDTDCHGGLECLSQICVRPAPLSGAGAGGGDSGANAEGGAGPGCTSHNTSLAPSDGLIADFADPDGGIEIMGGLFAYGSSANNDGAPNNTVGGGALHITENRLGAADPQYVGTYLYFEGCVDASAFSGIRFSIRGSFSGCSMQVFSTDSAHQDLTTGDPLATGPAGSYSPQTAITADQLSATSQTLTVGFATQSGGSPATPLDPRTLIGLFWQFTIPPAAAGSGEPACVADLTIDNVSFF